MTDFSKAYEGTPAVTAGTHTPESARALLAWAQAEARAGSRWWRGAEDDAASELALATLEGLSAERALARARSRLRRLLQGAAGGRPLARGAEAEAAGALGSLGEIVAERAPSARALALATGRPPRTLQRAAKRAREAAQAGQLLLPLGTQEGGEV
ncbi:MAG: hypothetical protein N2055_08715 [Tepidimonas taiwanensis]|nr:hypothetical protein [Tepidimonas taiwanensis]